MIAFTTYGGDALAALNLSIYDFGATLLLNPMEPLHRIV